LVTARSQAGVDLLSGEWWGGAPDTDLAWLREHEPVYWDGRVWGITRHTDVRDISLRPQDFCSGYGARPDSPGLPMMIDSDGTEHKRRRNLVNRGFTPRRLAESRPRISELCHQLIDDISDRGEIDAVMDLAAWLPLHVIGDMLGFPREMRGDLLAWSDDMVRMQGAPDPSAAERGITAAMNFRAFVIDAIRERTKAPGTDLLSLLVAGEAGVGDDPSAVEDVIYDSLLLLIGGDETTRHVLTGGLYQLLVDRTRWERLRSDPSLIPVAVEEMLRWVTPIKTMARTVVRDIEYGGKRLREGQKVVLLYSSANRDEAVFPEPFRFDLTRRPNDHLAFGVGTHFCLGNNLARLELHCFFEALLERLPDLSLVVPEEPALRPSNFVVGYEHLPVRFTPRPARH
jgi:cytochrome P450 family 142 subfamily A polypeptide 1